MKRNFPITASLAFAIGCLCALSATTATHAQTNTVGVEVITNGPQPSPGDAVAVRSASDNLRDSQRYEALVGANATFRAVRERKECGSISDPRMHADCLASFGK
jgi:hypothetical protein